MNMLSTIVPKSDQINADDLIGGPVTITIRDIKFSGGPEQPVSIYFDGSDKAYRPCKSMCRVLVAAWGPDAKAYIGRSMTLYRDPSVKWGGMEVGGIRISHMTDIDHTMTMALTATKGSRKPFVVKPLAKQAPPADKALEWAESQIASIGLVDDLIGYEKTVNAGLNAMKKLENSRPELFKAVSDAYRAKYTELTAETDPTVDTPAPANEEPF